MKAKTISRSSNWDTAYQGQATRLATIQKPVKRRRQKGERAEDLSYGKLVLFYSAVAVGVTSYILYLNQATIATMLGY